MALDWIRQKDVNWSFAEREAWKRSGFKNFEAVKDAVRNLPLEKKIEMLTEIHIEEMAEIHFEEKQEFLLKLGHKTWVDGDESYEYAKRVYGSDKDNIIERNNFQPVIVNKGRYVNIVNNSHMEKLKEKREGKKDE
jgi:hypothetical protein